MADITKFRIVRAPKISLPTDERVVRYPEPRDTSRIVPSTDVVLDARRPPVAVRDPQRTVRQQVVAAAQQFAASDRMVHPERPHLSSAALERLRSLHMWMESKNARFDAAELHQKLVEWRVEAIGTASAPERAAADLIALDDWADLRRRVGDSIIAQTTLKQDVRALQQLCAWFLCIAFVELAATLSIAELDALDKDLYLRRRSILLPWWTKTERTEFLGSGSIFARQPAFADFAVVREEWSCFVPGEIAHIENVLRGERKVREHVRTEETQTTSVSESDRTQIEERDTQSTERATLQEEASKQTSLEIGIEGQVDVNASYGPVEIATSFGASLGYSEEESRRKASEMSREVVNRSLSRIEERVVEKRATVRISKVVETNSHTIDNSVTPTGHVVGIYRWVDKISRLQIFTYPHRFVLEFQIPEPAAYVRWLERQRPPAQVDVPPPPAFENLEGQPLTPALVTSGTYLALAAKFGASGMLPPPDPRIVVSSGLQLKAEETLPTSQDTPFQFAPSMSAQIDLAVPPEYSAVVADVSVTGVPLLATWRDSEITDAGGDIGEHYYMDVLGYHEVTAAVAFAGQHRTLTEGTAATVRRSRSASGGGLRGWSQREAWFEAIGQIHDLDAGLGSGQLRASVVVAGALQAAVSIKLTCVRKDSTYEEWQIESFDRLREAHAAWRMRYEDALAAVDVQAGVQIEGRSPLRNAQTVREELKRQVIEHLLGHRFDGLQLVDFPADDAVEDARPTTRLSEAAATAPLVQFLEQVFEWTNMTYVMYPYYWAAQSRWDDLNRIDGADPSFTEFLRSGSARVVVPARPGFETDVLAFAVHGVPWSGGPVPLADDDDRYVSVAQEIQDMRGAPDEGVPGDLWEVKQPTTLVWLDDDSSLPKENTRRRLVGEPLIELCAHRES